MKKLNVRKPKEDGIGVGSVGIEGSRSELEGLKSSKFWEFANQKSCDGLIMADWPLEKAGLYVMRANNLIRGAQKRYRKSKGVEDS